MPLEKPETDSISVIARARKALSGVETGPSVITRHAKTAPGGPGVYRMIDAAGEVLYVGKARGLKKRVQSYARAGSHNNRIAAMIANTADMEFVTTPSETEALLLEANLIKRLKPRYNVVLRDDKSFPFILISRDHAFPQILKHRGARSRKGDYFGPFASAGAVGRTINTLQRAFLLRSCSDAYFETRVRPCLLFQIKRCSAPCTGEISEADYGILVDEALRFLTGESDEVKRRMHRLMDDASLKQDYERAASFRDRLTALSNVQSHQGINPENVKDADVFAAHQEAGQTAIQVFFFRTGNNWGNRAYFPRADKSLPVEEVLESFVAQFYDDKPPPKLVATSRRPSGLKVTSVNELLPSRCGGLCVPCWVSTSVILSRAEPIASGARPSRVVRVVIMIGRRRSRPACRMAWCRGRPAWRRSITCAISTMPMLTTTPISTMKPIIAIIVMVVPVSVRNQIEPTIANTIEVMIDSGYSADSNSDAMTRKISTTASSMFCVMVWMASMGDMSKTLT
mgnify:CR=1 FL=1